MPQLIADCKICQGPVYDIEGQATCPKCGTSLNSVYVDLAWEAYIEAVRKWKAIRNQHYAAMDEAQKAYNAYRALRWPVEDEATGKQSRGRP